MRSALPLSDYGTGFTFAHARAGEATALDHVRLVAWRRLVAGGADHVQAFVTVATDAQIGFRAWRGTASMAPAVAARRFKRFAKRVALPEWELSHALASIALADALPRVVNEVIALATSQSIDDTHAATVRLAAARVLLQAAGPIAPDRQARHSQTGPGADGAARAPDTALAAKIASDPVASDLYGRLLDRIDSLGGDGETTAPHGDVPRDGSFS